MDTPQQIRRAIRLLYLSAGLQSAYFATGTWLFFWRLYMTNGQIGYQKTGEIKNWLDSDKS